MEGSLPKQLVWVVFYGLSALGKTYFLNLFKETSEANAVNIGIVSSDDCSLEVITKYKARNPGVSTSEAMKKCRKDTIKLFESKISKLVDQLKPGKNIIVLDKVMNGGKFLQDINKTFTVKCPTKLVAIIPWTPSAFQYSYHGMVPFSEPLILNVCHRILSRAEHQTVEGSASKKLWIGLSFVKLYNGLKSLTEKQAEGGIEQFVDISFHQESEETLKSIPPKFTELIKKTLKELRAFQGEETVCNELASYLQEPETQEALKPLLAFGDAAQQKTKILEIIKIFETLGKEE